MKNVILILIITSFSFQLSAQYTEFIWDTITFEEPYQYLEIDNSSNNI